MSMATGAVARRDDDLGRLVQTVLVLGRGGGFVGIELGERLVDLGDDARVPAGSFLAWRSRRAQLARRVLVHSDTSGGIATSPLRERDGVQPRRSAAAVSILGLRRRPRPR